MTVRTVLLDPKPVSTNQQVRTAGRELDEHRRAWEQEMERAQRSAYLGDGRLHERTPGIQCAPTGPGEETKQLVSALQGFGHGAPTVTTTVGGVTREYLIGADLHPRVPMHHGNFFAASAAMAPSADGRLAATLHGTTAASPWRTERTPAPAIRLHADWSAEGVRLWLGLDSNVQGHMTAILDQVRQCMRAQGVRVLSLACNGQVVEDEAGVPTEYQETQYKEKKPWPSVP